MAASFWASSQRAQLLTRDVLRSAHAKDRAKGLTEDQLSTLTSFHIQYIRDAAKCAFPHGIRQRVAATGCVFFRRFYLHNNFCDIDPRPLAPAALYLAAKVEETLLQARYLLQIMQKLAGKYPAMPPVLEVKVLIDLEMALLEELDYRLVVWHPYSELATLLADADLKDIGPTAWSLLNDSYCTDVCMLYPPHIIALGCLNVAAALRDRDVQSWMEGLNIDLDQVYSVTLELTRVYESVDVDDVSELLKRVRN